MKAILLSIRPEWLVKILNGEKTIEVRKNKAIANAIKELIKQYGKALIYMYCSKEHSGWCMVGINGHKSYYEKYSKKSVYSPNTHEIGNGKVVARFWCDNVDRIWKTTTSVWLYETEMSNKLYEKSCLSDIELDRYFKPKALGFRYTYGHAIHISKLEIFDKPKELSEFYHYVKYNKKQAEENKQDWDFCKLTKAPQSWCYVEEVK